ncbi:MAG: hypothetical protein AB9903_28040 [Vulcanimicrobiota bacterium]
MTKKTRIYVMISTVLVLAGLCGVLSTAIPCRVIRINFPVEGGEWGSGILFEPVKEKSGPDSRPPLVFLLPGIMSPTDWYSVMARELTAHRYAACALYLPGRDTRRYLRIIRGASRYIQANHAEIDIKRKALFGQSYGAIPAIETAYFDEDVYAAVTAGYYMGGEVNASPRNLLLGTGVHDDLNGPKIVREAIKSFTGNRVSGENMRTGSFQDRTAREMYVSPYSNHATEKIDFYIMERLINWLDLSFGRTPVNPRLTYHYHIVFMLLCAWGSFSLLCYAATELLASRRDGGKIWITVLLAVGICFYIPGFPPLPVISLFTLVFLSGIIASYCLSLDDGKEESPEKSVNISLIIIAALFFYLISFVISDFIFTIKTLFSDRLYLSGFPGFIFISFVLTPVITLDALSTIIHDFYPYLWAVIMAGAVLWSAYEVKRLGFTGRIFKKTAAFFKFRRTTKLPGKQVLLLIVLGLLAIAAWVMVFLAGLAFIINTFLLTMIRYIFLPFILWLFFLSRLRRMMPATFRKDIREKPAS